MKLNVNLQILIFAAIFICAAFSINAQVPTVKADVQTNDEEGVHLFKTENGYLYVFNLETGAHQIELKGKKLEYMDSHLPLAFYIDGKFINLLYVLNKNYWKPKTKAKNNPSENELLEAHKIWESEYLGGRYKSKLNVSSEIFNLDSGRKVMYWSFPIPKQLDLEFSHQNFLTTLVGKNIIGISGSVKNADNEKAIRDYLTETINTIKVSNTPFNIKELRKNYKELELGEDNL